MIKPDIVMIETLPLFPFVNDTTLSALKSEFSSYVAASEDVSSDLSQLQFQKAHADKLPSWSETAKKVLLLQPSSAAGERAFSV
uniref:HAT C-terminal dimerisation domain-containing protein n=1 Tax=Amphimedon queenslandica TaxID=400682 RepID=A0A1X7UXI2_AMPQE